jgi:hypothetical protein|tara:strand:- start:624 stop:767 length:144 start_codon:yes stop_codon:yes gene_type:complete
MRNLIKKEVIIKQKKERRETKNAKPKRGEKRKKDLEIKEGVKDKYKL